MLGSGLVLRRKKHEFLWNPFSYFIMQYIAFNAAQITYPILLSLQSASTVLQGSTDLVISIPR